MPAPTGLRAEHLVDPIGLADPRPRLSWKLPPDLPRQAAFEVRADGGPGVEIESGESHLIDWPFEPLVSRRRVTWQVRARGEANDWTGWSAPAVVEAGLLDRGDWSARFVGGHEFGGLHTPSPAPLLRRRFDADGAVRRARLYVTALGVYACHLNGRRVGDDRLAPGWTDYRRRLQTQAYDVTGDLREGENVLTAELGDGWYAGHVNWQPRMNYGERPLLLAQLEVEYDNGRRQTVATDGQWQVSTAGPTRRADLLQGEHYDARAERADEAAMDWRPAFVVDVPPVGEVGLHASASPPVREQDVLAAVAVTRGTPGHGGQSWRFDLGQNLVGVARLDFAALRGRLAEGAADLKPGTTLRLRHAEMLDADGSLYRENLRSAEATDHYTCRGDEVSAGRVWQPQFTFHGFRHLEVVGLPKLADDAAVPIEFAKGVVIHNDMAPTGEFACADGRVNRLQHCIRWGQKGNFLSVPTDCPQRDERLGWTGDIQVFAPAACFNMDVAGFLAKWLLDVRDAQRQDGRVPPVCPNANVPGVDPWHRGERGQAGASELVGHDGGPAWADAAVVVPHTLWRQYGDLGVVRAMYDPMRRFIDYLRDVDSHGLIRRHALHFPWGGFGDWLALDGGDPARGARDGGTPKDLIGTAYFARCCRLLAEMAAALGEGDDARDYARLGDDVAAAFVEVFVTPTGRLAAQTQTSYLLALAFDLLPEDKRPVAVDHLLDLLERRGWKLTTGFVGTPLLLPTLTRFGHVNKAYRVLLSDAYPGWLYTVSLGATTMWERWNSWTPEAGFGPVEMNSFNHYAYGAVGQWLYETVGGLVPEEPGYRRARIAPMPGDPEAGEGLRSASCALETPYGRLSGAWSMDGGEFCLSAAVPPNTTATAELPDGTRRELPPGTHALRCQIPTRSANP